jgi:prepilin-type N-terminal cleavage/methylation domain-containing protein
MTARQRIGNRQGFTLVEILIVMAILGMVVAAMMSLYQSTQRQTYTQEEVVEVQQNLRIGLDQIVRDLRMAGFMIPTASDPIATASANTITLNTASTFGRIARIAQDHTLPSSVSGYNAAINVGLADMSDLFDSTDKVRVIRPPNQSEVLFNAVEVDEKDRTVPEISLTGFDAADAETLIKAGDVIVRVPSGSASTPDTITYSLSGSDLVRKTGATGTNEKVASKITGLVFRYLRDNDNNLYNSVAAADLDTIRAVEVKLTGATEASKTGSDQYGSGGVRTREITNVVTIRNR